MKGSLVEPFILHDDADEAMRLGLKNPFYTAEHEFHLVCWKP